MTTESQKWYNLLVMVNEKSHVQVAGPHGLVRRLPKRLFWDVPISSVEEGTHKLFIVQRVLERGGLEDIRRTIGYYSLPVVIKAAQEIRSLDPVTLAFAACIGNVPKESFRCYAYASDADRLRLG